MNQAPKIFTITERGRGDDIVAHGCEFADGSAVIKWHTHTSMLGSLDVLQADYPDGRYTVEYGAPDLVIIEEEGLRQCFAQALGPFLYCDSDDGALLQQAEDEFMTVLNRSLLVSATVPGGTPT